MYKGKKLILIFTLILTIVVAFTLFACTTNSNGDANGIASISVASMQKTPYILGEEVNLSDITILVTYNNGESKVVAVSDYMLSDSDRELFFVKGTNTIFINYEGVKVALQISVVNREDLVLYTAQFYSNGGSPIESQTGTVIETFYAPEWVGYTFDGWYTNFNLTGNKAKAPFHLNEDVKFYAKWIDNRVCSITFKDFYGEDVRRFDIVYGTSIDIRDTNAYPAPEVIEGMIFEGWSTSDGNTEEVTTDLVISAIYVSKNCIVQIYTDADAVASPKIFQKYYGDTFDVTAYELPTKAGHVSRWVVYKNDDITFEELPENGIITVKQEEITIKVYNVINTYTISIENGIAIQEFANLKAGSIATTPVYKDEDLKQSYKVNYGSNFNIANFIETPYLVHPQDIEGYNAVWCLVVTTHTGEIWYNAYNQIWNTTSQKFEAAEGGTKSQYELLDIDNNYVAFIKGNNSNPNVSVLESIDNVMGDITIKPKYIKKEYSVTLSRNENNSWITMKTFSVPYLNDFKLYDKTLKQYESFNFQSAEEVERSYLYKNVAFWLKDVAWNDIYWRSDSGLEDDWTIEWFTSSNLSASSKINFTETNGTLGLIEINKDITLYCKDTDQRRYNVTLYYDYDFAVLPTAPLSEIYKKREIYENLTENQIITLPENYSAPVIRTYNHDNSNYSIFYTFKGWYDFKYNDPSGYTGNLQNPESTRNRNVYFYAHYECTTTYNLLIYDKTQKTAYDGRVGYENNHFDVQEESIFYQLDAGTVFNSATMLFKGKVELGNITSGQRFQEKYAFIQWVNEDLTPQYNSLLTLYGGGNYSNAVSTLNNYINTLKNEIEACEALWGMLYTYEYGEMDLTTYNNTILTIGQYGDKQVQKKIYEDELDLIESYADNVILSNGYSQNMDDYKLYNNSIYTLNNAYDYSDIDIENDNVKYKFLGWYVDENYVTPYTGNIDFEWFVTSENLTLYAKWADQEKGTEGLVFQKMVIDGETFLAVVDLVNDAQYKASIYNGCGYNDLENKYYSMNLNDQGQVPINIGANLDIQVPKEHGGDNTDGYKVIGILKEAFWRYGNKIKSITMPASLKFIEERAFYNCRLENFYISSCDYVDADDSRALYQTMSYIVAPSEIDTVGALKISGINANAGTIIAYANKSVKDYLTLRSDTLRVANSAFSGASDLIYIDLGQSLVSIGSSAFEATGLVGHYDTANQEGSDTFVLPDSLVEIGASAFKNVIDLTNISYSTNCALSKVGVNALSSTKWYNSQVGPILINNNLIGIRKGGETNFVKDEFGEVVLFGEDLDEAKIVLGNNNMYYKQVDASYSLSRIEINDAIVSVSSGAFLDFSTIIAVEFNNCSALENIFDKAFENCTNIGDIYLYQSTSNLVLGTAVFKNCQELNIHVPNKNNVHSSFNDYEGLINLVDII